MARRGGRKHDKGNATKFNVQQGSVAKQKKVVTTMNKTETLPTAQATDAPVVSKKSKLVKLALGLVAAVAVAAVGTYTYGKFKKPAELPSAEPVELPTTVESSEEQTPKAPKNKAGKSAKPAAAPEETSTHAEDGEGNTPE